MQAPVIDAAFRAFDAAVAETRIASADGGHLAQYGLALPTIIVLFYARDSSMPLARLEFGASADKSKAQGDRIESQDYLLASSLAQQNEKFTETSTAIKQAPPVAAMSDQLGDELTRRIGAAHARFATAARDAASALDGLALAIPLVTVIAAVLAFLGLRQRINEYR